MTIKRYCRYKGIMCSRATEFGYCNLTACINRAAMNQEHKTGKWITKSDANPYYTSWWYECSECGQKPLRNGYEQEVLSDYCPSCGARMGVEE